MPLFASTELRGRASSAIMRRAAPACALVLATACLGPGVDFGAASEALGPRDGVDYSWGRPSPDGLVAAGYTFACRYYSWDTTGKNLTPAEADRLITAGVDIVSNWESTANSALGGHSQGVEDATEANRQAANCGAPAERPIYFSVDFDATPGQQDAINSYFDGVASVIGRERTGAYGGYWVIKRLFDAGKITYGWQTYAWSGGMWDDRAQLRQVRNGVTIAGADCDIDHSVADDFGQWPMAAWSAAYSMQTFPLAADAFELAPAQEFEGYIEMLNTGTETWEPDSTFLGTTEPRDGASALAHPTWINDHRPATVDHTVAPGETGRFTFTLRAPSTPGDYPQFFNLVEEGVAWFSDSGLPPDDQLQVRVTVVAPPACPADLSSEWGCEGASRIHCGADGHVEREPCPITCVQGVCTDGSPPDAGTPEVDAGIPEVDAGVPLGTDDAAIDQDAGVLDMPRGTVHGCSCRAAGAPAGRFGLAPLWMALGLVLARARHRSAKRGTLGR